MRNVAMKLLENLAAMIKVKTLVTVVVIGVFAYLSVSGRIDSDSVMLIVSTVIAFYFGTVTEKKG